jgi:hypothetical protein
MDDLKLLEQYEPVLRFAKSERFFPMAVEPYLERCMIFPSGPHGAGELFGHLNEPLVGKVGRLHSHEYFLRFVNKPLFDFDAWLWWGGFSALGAGMAWLVGGVIGLEVAVFVSLAAVLVLFMLASPIRLRIIPALLAAFLFMGLGIAPIWFFLHPNETIGVAVEYLILFPIYLLALFMLSIFVLKIIIERVLPEGPGLVMDMLSQATERIARESYYQYADILKGYSQPVYYGRVVRETGVDGSAWTILQYHYFYAFNDWRLAANGFNHHEGDWEMAAVYLKDDAPYAVLMSQHGAGNIEPWEQVIKALDEEGKETSHPVLYAALGSHAIYSKPAVIRSPTMYRAGRVQRFLYWFDGLAHYLFLWFNPHQKARQIALKEMQEQGIHLFDEDAFEDLKDESDHYIVRLPMEIATGEGVRLGAPGKVRIEPRLLSVDYLKNIMSERAVTHPPVREWKCILLDSAQPWVQYKGLWGVKSFLTEESGPPGPKWDRLRKGEAEVKERTRWAAPLDWLEELEDNKH